LKKNKPKYRGLSAEDLKILFENANDIIIFTDTKGNIIDVNKAVKKILGYKRKDILGKNFTKLGVFEIKNLKNITKLFLKVRASGKLLGGKDAVLMELELKHKNGKKVVFESNTRLIKEKGKTRGFLSILRDITDKKLSEERLKESEERLEYIIEYAPDGIFILDLKGKILDVNKEIEKMVGYKKEELIGKNLFKLGIVPKKYIPKALKFVADSKKGGKLGPSIFEINRKDRKVVILEVSSFPVKTSGKLEIIGIGRDVTDREELEEETKKLNEELKSKVEQLEKFNKIAVGRELKMIELKKKIKDLEKKLRGG
jgi:PAS domain S-box-containing protein